SEFSRSAFTEAEKTARDKASRMIGTQVQESMEENLGADDPKEWNWKALSHQMNTRYGLSTNDRQLRQMGKDQVAQYLIEQAEHAVAATDLSGGRGYMDPEWGLRSIGDWARLKFQIKLTAEDLANKSDEDI